ncbi:MAG TPA: hypothetical protein VGF55_18980 [Gemmataceae bacterium]|jgi:hypothetical protein
MGETLTDPRELVMTQAEPARPRADAADEPPVTDGSLLLELQNLADRAGGLDRLRDLVDALRRSHR